MPKDPTKNVDRYKIRGGHLNEFDFTQNQEELAEKQTTRRGRLIPGTPPEEKREGLRPVVTKTTTPGNTAKSTNKKAAAKTTSKKATAKNTSSGKARVAIKGASAKKLAARKAAKNKAK